MKDRDRPLKLAIIDNYNVFATDVITPPLFSQLTANHGMDVLCYVPRYRRGEDTHGIPMAAVRFVWSSINYPFKIFLASRRDRRTEALVMLEQGTFGPPVALLQLPVLFMLLRLAKCRIVVNLQGIVPLENFDYAIGVLLPKTAVPKPLLRVAVFALYSSVFALADQIQVYAPTFAKWVHGYGSFQDKIRLVSAGVSDPPGRIHDRRPRNQYVLAFGHVVRRKGLDAAVKAWKAVCLRFPNCQLVIAGSMSKDPEYVEELKNLIRENGLSGSVSLVGPVSDEQMHLLFQDCFAAIFPYVYSDSASGPLCTALQHRKLIIASRIGLFKDLFQDGEAVFCEPREPMTISDAVLSLLGSQDLRSQLISRIEKLAQRMNWDGVGREYFSLIREAAN